MTTASLTPAKYKLLADHQDALAARATEKSETIYHTLEAQRLRELQREADEKK